MPQVNVQRKAVVPHPDTGDQVEAMERQLSEVFMRQRFIVEMALHQPDPAQEPAAETDLLEIPQRKAVARSDNDLIHQATPGNDQPDSATNLPGDFTAGSCQLRSDDLTHGYPTAVQALQSRQGTRFQSTGMSVDRRNNVLRVVAVYPAIFR